MRPWRPFVSLVSPATSSPSLPRVLRGAWSCYGTCPKPHCWQVPRLEAEPTDLALGDMLCLKASLQTVDNMEGRTCTVEAPHCTSPPKPNLGTADKRWCTGHSRSLALPIQSKGGGCGVGSPTWHFLGKRPSQAQEGLNYYHRGRVNVCRRERAAQKTTWAM